MKKLSAKARREAVRNIVKCCGGSMLLAIKLKTQQTAVIQWGARGKIPKRYAPGIHKALAAHGDKISRIDFEGLPIFQ